MSTDTLPARQIRAVSTVKAVRLMVIGPTPPPYNGMSVATNLVLRVLPEEITVIHLDTADRRALANVGKIDVQNVLLALKHAIRCLYLLLLKNPNIVYVPIAQDQLAFLRDGLFLVPARLLGKKVVVHLHGGYFDKFYESASPAMRSFVRYAIGNSDRAIVLGECLTHMFSGLLPRDRIRVIPNGIPDSFGEANFPADHPRPTILFLSTLMKEKGILDLLSALPRITERVPHVQAVFAGEWLRSDEQATALGMVRDLKLEEQVHFAGPVAPPRKYDLFRAADVFVMPTYYKNEGHPYVLLEAMSAGLPIVSTKNGCIPETVIDGVNGFVIDSKNGDQLVDRVVCLLTDNVLRKRMGRASRQRFLELYTLDRFSKDMRGVFRELGEALTEPS